MIRSKHFLMTVILSPMNKKDINMRLRLIEYKNIVNDKGQAYGHAEKALNDTVNICKKLGINYEVATALDCVNNQKSGWIALPYSFKVSEYDYRNFSKIIKNLRVACNQNCDDETLLWFINVDWYLFLFLAFWRGRNKVLCTIYKDRYDQINSLKGKKGKIGDLLYRLGKTGINKVSLFFETFESDKRDSDSVYIPDYVYTAFYDSIRTEYKKDQVICPGTINVQKDVEGLVDVFSRIDYPLLIAGEFVNNELFNKLDEIKTKNVSIQNRRLEYDEYYTLIAQSKYCITPYDMKRYGSATSGVIREAIYLGTTVIAPEQMLHNMGLQGIGYNKLQDLTSIFQPNRTEEYINDLDAFKEENVVNTIRDALGKLSESTYNKSL